MEGECLTSSLSFTEPLHGMYLDMDTLKFFLRLVFVCVCERERRAVQGNETDCFEDFFKKILFFYYNILIIELLCLDFFPPPFISVH